MQSAPRAVATGWLQPNLTFICVGVNPVATALGTDSISRRLFSIGEPMMKRIIIVLSLIATFCSGVVFALSIRQTPGNGYVVERDVEMAKNEPGPHDAGGRSTGKAFF